MPKVGTSSRAGGRQREKAGDPNRFYCPFPGCCRSFIDLWRLKVHYRAEPNVRGSGKERGHGQELPACPKCGKVLERNRHHVNCAAGKAAPSQASKKAEKELDQKSCFKKKAGWGEETGVRNVLGACGELQISLDSAVRGGGGAAVPAAGLSSQGQVGHGCSRPPICRKVVGEGQVPGGGGGGLKSRLASRPGFGLSISPVDSPMFEGQLDSTDSLISSDTLMSLSPLPVTLPAPSPTSSCATLLHAGAGSAQQRTRPPPLNVKMMAMPAQSITPVGPGPLDLSDCQVTGGYAVFVGSEEEQYDVFFVPGGEQQDPATLPVLLTPNSEGKLVE